MRKPDRWPLWWRIWAWLRDQIVLPDPRLPYLDRMDGREQPQTISIKVYLVVEMDSGNSYETKRVYLDREEAEAFVEAYNASTAGYLEIEEMTVGAPDVEYDEPIWFGTWTTRRKQKGEKQLVLMADGFTTVIPSAIPSGGGYRYPEFFTGPEWRDLLREPVYEEPPVWIDNFHYRQEWHTGDDPGPAAVELATTGAHSGRVEVRGTSRDAVEELLRSTALQVKAELE